MSGGLCTYDIYIYFFFGGGVVGGQRAVVSVPVNGKYSICLMGFDRVRVSVSAQPLSWRLK